MRRRGSPFTGAGVVLAKEAADYLSGARMWLLEALVFLTAIAAAYAAILSIRASIGESPFLFLRLLTMAQDPLPSFIALLGFLIPLVAIAIGFDAINGEFNRRTLSRVLAQPIYRDALLLGKFLAGLVALAIGLLSLWLLTIGLGLLFLGLPPNTKKWCACWGFSLRRSPMAGSGWRWPFSFPWCSAHPPPRRSPLSAYGSCSHCSGRW
jgi:ABC-2 type transport system permease protein